MVEFRLLEEFPVLNTLRTTVVAFCVIVLCVCVSVTMTLVGGADRDALGLSHTTIGKMYSIVKLPTGTDPALPRCSWSAPEEHPWSNENEKRARTNVRFAAFFQRLTDMGVPVVLRNGNLLVQRRQRPALDRRVGLDVDAMILMPSRLSKAQFKEFLQQELLAAGFPGAAAFEDAPQARLFLGDMAMWHVGDEPGYLQVDLVVVPEWMVASDTDYVRQVAIKFDVNLTAAWTNVCVSRYFGSDVLSFEEPHVSSLLKAGYGRDALTSTDTSAAMPMNLVYPGWLMRTRLGRWAYCYATDSESDGFLFETSAQSAVPYRDNETGKLRGIQGDGPAKFYHPGGPVPGCGKHRI